MHELQQLVDEFIRWWNDASQAPDFTRRRFTPDFTYQKDPGPQDEDAVWLIEQSPPWVDFKVTIESINESRAAFSIVGIEYVAMLPYYVEFELTFRGLQIASVQERAEILDSPSPGREDMACDPRLIESVLMKGFELASILHRRQRDYDVVLTRDGRALKISCRVVGEGDLRVVKPAPDVFCYGGFDPRPIVAAVLTFDRIVQLGACP